MAEWRRQVGHMYAAQVDAGILYAGSTDWSSGTDAPAPKRFFWELQHTDEGLPSKWGYADTLEEAKALALATAVLG